MKRFGTAAMMLILAAGCGNGFDGRPQQSAEPAAAPLAKTTEDQSSMKGHGADFRLFDGDPTSGSTRKPRLWLHVDTFALAEKNIWSFEKAHAVIYGRDEQMEDMFLEAGGGVYQEAKSAYLKEGVVAQIGGMRLELRDFEWLNEEGVAQSDYPVRIITPASDLQASSVRLYHKEKRIVLTDVEGTLRLERTEQ